MKLWVPILLVLAASCSAQPVGSGQCPGSAFYEYTNGTVSVFVCDGSDKRLLDQMPAPGEGIRLAEVEVGDGRHLVLLNAVSDLSADDPSVHVDLYDSDRGEKILSAQSKASASIGDINEDGIHEIVLYVDIVNFDSLLLSNTGWPLIVELRDTPTIGVLKNYDDLRTRLLDTAFNVRNTLMEACEFEGRPDPICGANDDIERLGLFIRMLEIRE